MKRLMIILFAVVLFTACNEKEPEKIIKPVDICGHIIINSTENVGIYGTVNNKTEFNNHIILNRIPITGDYMISIFAEIISNNLTSSKYYKTKISTMLYNYKNKITATTVNSTLKYMASCFHGGYKVICIYGLIDATIYENDLHMITPKAINTILIEIQK